MKERIVRYTKEELKRLKGKTDHTFVEKTTDADIERQVNNSSDDHPPPEKELKEFKKVNKDGTHE